MILTLEINDKIVTQLTIRSSLEHMKTIETEITKLQVVDSTIMITDGFMSEASTHKEIQLMLDTISFSICSVTIHHKQHCYVTMYQI